MAEYEDEQKRQASEEDFRQRVFTSAINLLVGDFYQRIFDPSYVPAVQDEADLQEVFFPATDDEFDQMLAEFEAADAALKTKQFYDPIEES